MSHRTSGSLLVAAYPVANRRLPLADRDVVLAVRLGASEFDRHPVRPNIEGDPRAETFVVVGDEEGSVVIVLRDLARQQWREAV